MRGFRRLVIGGALAGLTLTAVVTPATALDTKGTLAIVNGFPGRKVDVCLNGQEIKSGLPYGGKILRNDTSTGSKKLRFYARDAHRCKGTLLAKKSFPLAPAEDLTIVLTKSAPRIVKFVNVGLGEIPPLGAPILDNAIYAWRNASEMAVNMRWRFLNPGFETPIGPSADPIWVKGQHHGGVVVAGVILELRARLPESADTLTRVRYDTIASHRQEHILVGSKPGNAMFVAIDRVVSSPSQ